MPALPLSVRFALWATVSVRGEVDPDDAVVAAHPDVDDISGEPAGRLELWRDFGESAVLVALPRPGDLTGMPRTSLDGSGAAADAGECVFVPGMGGLLVPTLTTFGPEGDEGTSVVKVFLHESKEEQRQRLQERLDDPEKRWKFRAGDLDDRALWDDFEAAYEDAIRATSTEDAPWYVVPADHNWSRNLCVAEILVDALERLDPKLPEPVTDKAAIV